MSKVPFSSKNTVFDTLNVSFALRVFLWKKYPFHTFFLVTHVYTVIFEWPPWAYNHHNATLFVISPKIQQGATIWNISMFCFNVKHPCCIRGSHNQIGQTQNGIQIMLQKFDRGKLHLNLLHRGLGFKIEWFPVWESSIKFISLARW